MKDPISGFEGIVTTEYRSVGYERVEVTSNSLHEGKPIEAWFDSQRLEVIATAAELESTK